MYRNLIDLEIKVLLVLILFGRFIRDVIFILMGRYFLYEIWIELMFYREMVFVKRYLREYERWNEYIYYLLIL